MTRELLNSCLILTANEEKIDKIKLVEVANQFCFESEHRFSIVKVPAPERTKI